MKRVDGSIKMDTVNGVLSEFARLLRMLLRKLIVSEILHARFTVDVEQCRYFGDEFVLIAPLVLAETYFDGSRFNSEAPESCLALVV